MASDKVNKQKLSGNAANRMGESPRAGLVVNKVEHPLKIYHSLVERV